MMSKDNWERACVLCESSRKIEGGEYCVCTKKGVVSPDFCCRKFRFDPLKMEVTVQKLPSFPEDFSS